MQTDCSQKRSDCGLGLASTIRLVSTFTWIFHQPPALPIWDLLESITEIIYNLLSPALSSPHLFLPLFSSLSSLSQVVENSMETFQASHELFHIMNKLGCEAVWCCVHFQGISEALQVLGYGLGYIVGSPNLKPPNNQALKDGYVILFTFLFVSHHIEYLNK